MVFAPQAARGVLPMIKEYSCSDGVFLCPLNLFHSAVTALQFKNAFVKQICFDSSPVDIPLFTFFILLGQQLNHMFVNQLCCDSTSTTCL